MLNSTTPNPEIEKQQRIGSTVSGTHVIGEPQFVAEAFRQGARIMPGMKGGRSAASAVGTMIPDRVQ